MGLLEDLAFEHQTITNFLDVFRDQLRCLQNGELVAKESLQKYLNFVQTYIEETHHYKEEVFLFPELDKMQLLQGGGPKCILFFGLFIEQKFLERIKAEVKPEDGIPPYQPRSEIFEILNKKSPLTIPLSDHEVGYYAYRLMELELKKYQESWDSERFCRVAQLYVEMVHYHVRKEDECLFVRIKNLLSEEDKQRLSELAANFTAKSQSKVTAVLHELGI